MFSLLFFSKEPSLELGCSFKIRIMKISLQLINQIIVLFWEDMSEWSKSSKNVPLLMCLSTEMWGKTRSSFAIHTNDTHVIGVGNLIPNEESNNIPLCSLYHSINLPSMQSLPLGFLNSLQDYSTFLSSNHKKDPWSTHIAWLFAQVYYLTTHRQLTQWQNSQRQHWKLLCTHWKREEVELKRDVTQFVILLADNCSGIG